jgi:uncharacterized alkaline shock family protein YloU
MTVYGRITISPQVISTIAAQSALRSYGVVGMASKNLMQGITRAFTRDPSNCIDVEVIADQILIDVYVIVEYGTRIASVAASVANTVRYQVERALGMPVVAVNVHVQDLRISNRD